VHRVRKESREPRDQLAHRVLKDHKDHKEFRELKGFKATI